MYHKNLSAIYVLELEYNKYYIGKTSYEITASTGLENIMQNLHIKSANTWYDIYKPIKLIEYVQESTQVGMIQYIISYMAKYGIDNVRGGCFSEITLSYTDYIVLSKMIRETYNHCLYCNSEQHTYSECPNIPNTLESHQYVINAKENSKTENSKKENDFRYIEEFTIIEKEDVT